MYYHIVLGEKISTLLSLYFSDAALDHEHQVLALFDDLSFGSLRDENLTFSDLRNHYWASLKSIINEPSSHQINDLEQLLALRSKMVQNESFKLVFWQDNTANSILYYYLIIHYFKHFSERLFTINALNLPFLDDQLRLFYPTYIYQIPPKELRKALKLLRPISKPEIEADTDEFAKYQSEKINTYRILSKGKTITSLSYNEIGKLLLEKITSDSSKSKKVLNDWQSGVDSMFASFFYKYFLYDLSEKGLISHQNNIIIKL